MVLSLPTVSFQLPPQDRLHKYLLRERTNEQLFFMLRDTLAWLPGTPKAKHTLLLLGELVQFHSSSVPIKDSIGILGAYLEISRSFPNLSLSLPLR